MKLCGMTSREDIPEDFPQSPDGQLEWFDRLVTRFLDRIWLQPDPEDLRVVAEAYKQPEADDDDDDGPEGDGDIYPFCFCHEGEKN